MQFVLLGAKLRMCTSQSLSASPLAHTSLTHFYLPERPIHSAKHKEMLRDMRTNEWANITPRFKEDWEFQGSWTPAFQSTQWKKGYICQQRSPICLSLMIPLLTKQIKHNFGLFQQPIYTGKHFLQTVALSGYCAAMLK